MTDDRPLVDADFDMTHLVEVAPYTKAQARRVTERIKLDLIKVWGMIADAYKGRIWIPLGYSNWDDYCATEFGPSRLRLPREERAEVVSSLRDAGLSIRAIASATGDSRDTVHKALTGVRNLTPAEDEVRHDVAPAGRCPHCEVNPPRGGDTVCDACHGFMERRGERAPEDDPARVRKDADLCVVERPRHDRHRSRVTGLDGKQYPPRLKPRSVTDDDKRRFELDEIARRAVSLYGKTIRLHEQMKAWERKWSYTTSAYELEQIACISDHLTQMQNLLAEMCSPQIAEASERDVLHRITQGWSA